MAKLGDLVTIQKGKKPPVSGEQRTETSLPLILTGNLRGVKTTLHAEPFAGQVTCSSADVLISWDGTIGVTACGLEGVVGSTLAALRIREPEKLRPRYLWHFLRTKEAEIQNNPRGSSIPHVNPDLLNSFEVPGISIALQDAIVAKLDYVDRLTASLVAQLDALRSIESNLFDSMLGELPWEISIRELSNVQIGPFGSLLHASDYISGGIPVLNPTHIRGKDLAPDTALSVSQEVAERLTNYRVKAGDVLLGRRGEMGRAAVVTPALEGALCGTGSVIVRPNDGTNSTWLRALLSSTRMKHHLESSSIGSTLPNLNATIIQNSPAPAITKQEQEEFEEKVHLLGVQIAGVEKAIATASKLFLAIQSEVRDQ